MRLTIICPFHKETEELTLPDSYKPNFSGEVPCGAEAPDKAVLHLTLSGGDVAGLKTVQVPPVGPITL